MLRLLLGVPRDLFRSQASLEAEIVTLRHQVTVLHRRLGRRKLQLTWADRALLVLVARVWSGWGGKQSSSSSPKPCFAGTGRGFRAYWRWKSRPRDGRPRIPTDVREVIARMHRENPLWGAPRIHGELLMLGIQRASPWQNGYCERVIGTLQRECLDHVVAVNERQVQRVLDEYQRYYNRSRTHLSLK